MKFEAGNPANANAAVKVKIVRITLNVDYIEGVAISEGEGLELVDAKISINFLASYGLQKLVVCTYNSSHEYYI